MPHLAIPEGPRVRWGDRRRSRVHLTHSLKISADSIRFTLDLPRSCFADFETGMSTMQAVASTLLDTEPRLRLRRTAGPIKISARLPSDSRLRATITFARCDLPALRKAIRHWRETSTDLGMNPTEDLASHLYCRCFPKVARLITTPPRRNGIEQRRVTGYIAVALRAAHRIVALGRSKDERIQERIPAIRDRIEAICEEYPAIRTYCAVAKESGWDVEQALAVGLVDRAFHGAWEATDHPGLMYTANADVALHRKHGKRPPDAIRFRDPRDVYRQYLYRDRALSEHLLKMKRDRPHLLTLYVKWAEQAFLGKPGAAARYYRLIP